VERRILTQLRTGKGILSVAKQFKVGTGTVQRIAREMGGDRPFADAARNLGSYAADIGVRP
jgi:hypothetical protein